MDNKKDISLSIIEAMKKSTGKLELAVHGTSMSPLMDDGDNIIFKKTNKYHVGDIIVFERTQGTVITHRLLFKTRKHLYIKGDATVAIDKVDNESIIGTVYKIRKIDLTISITRRLYVYPVIVLSFLMNRIWKYTGSFSKASSSIFARTLKRIIAKHYNLNS